MMDKRVKVHKKEEPLSDVAIAQEPSFHDVVGMASGVRLRYLATLAADIITLA